MTPLLAGRYTEDLAPKTPPIRFDRAPDGRLLVPGRWWQRTFERTAEEPEDPALTADERAWFRLFAYVGDFADTLLPADTDTIEVAALVNGRPVMHEALPPGTVLSLVVRLRRPGA